MKVWIQNFLTFSIIKGFSRCHLIVFIKRVKSLCPQHNKNKIISYHYHHRSQTGRSWGTALQSCCLYYFLQNRSLLQRHQPLYLHWQQKQSKMVLYRYAYLPTCRLPSLVIVRIKTFPPDRGNEPLAMKAANDFWSVWSFWAADTIAIKE